MTCAFCKTNAYGCTPGRCFSPRSRADDEKPKSKSAPPRPKGAPLGPRRLVITSALRTGPGGGTYFVLELECGHGVWRRGVKRAPRTEICIDCGNPMNIVVACGCGCGKTAGTLERMQNWVWMSGTWVIDTHFLKMMDTMRRYHAESTG